MSRMVDDLFELSRIHAGVLRSSPTPLSLGDLVSEAIAAAEPVARRQGVRLGGRVEPGLRSASTLPASPACWPTW